MMASTIIIITTTIITIIIITTTIMTTIMTTPEEEQKEEIDRSSLQGKIIVGVDPGKRSILYLTTDDKSKTKDGSLKYT